MTQNFVLLCIGYPVFFGLFCHHPVVSHYRTNLVKVAVVLVQEDIRRLALFIRQIVSRHLAVVWFQLLQHFRTAQPPVRICHTYCGISTNTGIYLFSDISAQGQFIKRSKGRIDFGYEHIPTGHSGIFLLIGVKRIVPFFTIAPVVRHKLFKRIILSVFPGVVAAVTHFLLVHPPCTFVMPAANGFMVLMCYGCLERTVQSFSIFLL